jgi:dTDP-glucose 4,6-dehydratase
MKKIVLLTGASGFLGSHMLRHILINTDWYVICIINNRHQNIPKRIFYSVKGIDEDFKRVSFFYHDLREKIDSKTKIPKNIDLVINCASDADVSGSIKNPTNSIKNNVEIITNLLEWVRGLNIEKFIHVSSDEVYGPTKDGQPQVEWNYPYFPSTPYSAGKAAQENICYAYWKCYDVPIVIVNSMNLIGETQPKDKFLMRIINKIEKNEEIELHCKNGIVGNRFYMHARNYSDAVLNILLMDNLFIRNENPPKFHIKSEKSINNLDLINLIGKIMGKTPKYKMIEIEKVRPGYDLTYDFDANLFSSTGWREPIKIEENLIKIVQWTLENKNYENL